MYRTLVDNLSRLACSAACRDTSLGYEVRWKLQIQILCGADDNQGRKAATGFRSISPYFAFRAYIVCFDPPPPAPRPPPYRLPQFVSAQRSSPLRCACSSTFLLSLVRNHPRTCAETGDKVKPELNYSKASPIMEDSLEGSTSAFCKNRVYGSSFIPIVPIVAFENIKTFSVG